MPLHSLARRRARAGEFTAAHNHLPFDTLVRVTNKANGKTAVVRITDRGITDKHFEIDISKEAARQIGMIRAGVARVHLEILPDAPSAVPTDPTRATAH